MRKISLWMVSALLLLISSQWGCESVNERRARRLANKAVKMLRHDQFNGATSLLKQAVRLNPRDAHIRYMLGRAYEATRSNEQAITEYKRSIALKPSYHPPHYSLGKLYLIKQKPAMAAPILKKGYDLKPSHRNTAYQLGMAYHQLKKHPQAAFYYGRATKADPKFVPAYNAIVKVRLDQVRATEDEDILDSLQKKALEALNKAISNRVANERTYNLLGLLHLKRKQFAQAVAAFTKAKGIKRYSPTWAFNLGATYDYWLEEMLNQAKLEKDKACKEEFMKRASEKRDKAISAFKAYLQLKSGNDGQRSAVREKIMKLKLMRDQELAKKLKKRRRRRRRR